VAELSERYARALFELCAAHGTLAVCKAQAVQLHQALNDPAIKKLFAHPHFSNHDKKTVLREPFGGEMDAHLNGFVGLMIDRARENMMGHTLARFISKVNEHEGLAEVTVVSARALTAAQTDALCAVLSRMINKKIILHTRIDPSVIGGLRIQMDGICINHTSAHTLSSIKKQIIG
jgi:F-type H+-transporting ATPase subunit delta